jgi:hypothetical protein
LTIHGIIRDSGDIFLCGGVFDNEDILMPAGGIIRRIGEIGSSETKESDILTISLSQRKEIPVDIPNHEIIICDVRFKIFKSYVVVCGKGFASNLARIVDHNGTPLYPICSLREQTSKRLSDIISIEDNRMIFVEPFADTYDVLDHPNQLHQDSQSVNKNMCLFLSRESTIGEIQEYLCKYVQTEAELKLTTKTEFPFPVMTCRSNLHRPVYTSRNRLEVVRDLHYHVNSGHPADAIIVRDGYDFYHYYIDRCYIFYFSQEHNLYFYNNNPLPF